MKKVRSFLADCVSREDGAITVDWVVLTASLLLLGFVVVAGISDDVSATKAGIATCIAQTASCD